MRKAARYAALFSLLAAGGCATPTPDLPPLLDISTNVCTAKPDLTAALATAATIDGEDPKPATVSVDEHASCLDSPDGKSLYTVFLLPDGGPFTVSISSAPLGRSLFAPRASVLDAQGALLHELPPASFMFRGKYLTALYRSHPGERYLVVASDPPSVGKPLQRVQESVQQTYVTTGYVSAVIYTGSDISQDTTWSHNGSVSVIVVRDKPPKS